MSLVRDKQTKKCSHHDRHEVKLITQAEKVAVLANKTNNKSRLVPGVVYDEKTGQAQHNQAI